MRNTMPIEITMPKLSDTMEEGTILQWRIKEGDRVRKGQVIAEVETDKAAMEMEAFEDGVVRALKVDEGATVAVGTVIAVFDGEGRVAGQAEEVTKPELKTETKPVKKSEEKPEEKVEAKPEAKEAKEKEEKEEKEEKVERRERPATPPARGISVSPVARKLAREKGLDLGRIRGTGPGGRIVLADVERATPEKAPAPAPAEAGARPERPAGKSVKIRRIVARKMLESWQNIPHFFVTVAVDMTDVIRFRKDLEVSINDFIVAATARSLHEHPWVNSHWIDGEAVEQESINIAMAVATERGLYNPVIHDCGNLSLKEISRRARDLADKAHQGKLVHADLEGGTFTISNMGMLGVESFSAIITPPQAAVLAVGTVKGEVVVDDQGEPGIAPILRLTLSADHRTLDGADAAEFLGTMKSYLEAPVTLVTCNYGQEKE
jgi:pyruvate dehydrogenase E2 component (dihydrolipoamide acetyltransferase)